MFYIQPIANKKNDLVTTVTLKTNKEDLCHRLPPLVAQSPTLKTRVNIIFI